MVGLRVYFILSFVLSSFSRLCDYKSENNFVSCIENPLLTPPHFQSKIQTLQCGPWAPYDLATHPPGSRLPARLCVCVLESPGDEPSGGPFPGPRGSSPSSGPWLRPVCVSVSTHPIVRWQNTYGDRTRLSSPAAWPESPCGEQGPSFSCVCSTHHSIWCLVVLNESTWEGSGGQREEQVEKLNESLIGKRKQCVSFCTLPAQAAFPTEPSCVSTNERSSDFEVPVAPFRGTLANASSAPPFFLPVLYLQD